MKRLNYERLTVAPNLLRPISCLLAISLAWALPCSALDTPLSDTAVRQAYFLGQRHDESLGLFYSKYMKFPPLPQTGPHISEVRFLTPFAQLVEYSEHFHGNYSAQQALRDHRGKSDLVKVIVQISFTQSYGRLLPPQQSDGSLTPTERSPRSPDFWKDFQVVVSNDDQPLTPSHFSGRPTSICGKGGHCLLTGASLELTFPAESFTSDTAVIHVVPPEGEPVTVEFSLTSLR